MKSGSTIKEQRDRFLAFAFASADLFMEVSPDGNIIYALGAAKGLTGIDDQSLLGKNWLELFAVHEQGRLGPLRDNAKVGMRCGPFIMDLNKNLSNKKGVVTGIKMPTSHNFFLTLSISSVLMEEAAEVAATNKEEPMTTGFEAKDEKFDDSQFNKTKFKDEVFDDRQYNKTTFKDDEAFDDSLYNKVTFKDDDAFDDSIYNKHDFVSEAQKTFEAVHQEGIESAVTVFDFGRSQTIPDENWSQMITQISNFLQEESIGGHAAAEFGNNKYSIIHDSQKDTAALKEKITALSKELDPAGQGIEVSTKTLEADLRTISSQEAARALYYTLNEFEKNGMDINIDTLSSSLKTLVSDNTSKIDQLKKIIEQADFDIYFQPIVNLKTKEAKHYEVLSRFKKGETQDWIMFGEDVGLAPVFDIAVVERTMNFIHYKAGVTRTKFSINLSGKSIQDQKFFTKLTEKLAKRDFAKRILFEITESTQITDLKKVNSFIHELQKAGYEIALDDFGAGAASFEYLQQLKVDYVKIDGKYIRKILNSSRDEVMIRGLVKMCKDLNTKVIAEFVETQEQADLLKEIGVDYAQGFLYGKAEPKPSYVPSTLISA